MESKKELASIIMQKEKLDMVDGKMVRDQNGSHQRNITKLYRSNKLLSESKAYCHTYFQF